MCNLSDIRNTYFLSTLWFHIKKHSASSFHGFRFSLEKDRKFNFNKVFLLPSDKPNTHEHPSLYHVVRACNRIPVCRSDGDRTTLLPYNAPLNNRENVRTVCYYYIVVHSNFCFLVKRIKIRFTFYANGCA